MITPNRQPRDQQRTGGRGYLCLIAGAAALGGLLFGYDTAVISGAIGFIEALWVAKTPSSRD
jgi:hypothetical protein